MPYKPDLLWRTLRPRNRPGRARTVEALAEDGEDVRELVRADLAWYGFGRTVALCCRSTLHQIIL